MLQGENVENDDDEDDLTLITGAFEIFTAGVCGQGDGIMPNQLRALRKA